MSVTQARGVAKKAKKHPPILFSGRLLRLRVGPQRRTFSAHEDMVCTQSKVFKNKFQTVRKDVEGECAICYENLDAAVKSLTYCKACGNNLHQDCMKEWNIINSTCPICRAEWVKSPFVNNFNLPDTDADGFDVYVQWLYRRAIPIYAADEEGVKRRCMRLVKAHVVGDSLRDKEFVKAVRHEIVQSSMGGAHNLGITTINTAYEMTDGPCTLRKFIINLCVLSGGRGYWTSRASTLCRAASIDLTACFLKKAEQQDSERIWSSLASAGYIEQENSSAEDGDG